MYGQIELLHGYFAERCNAIKGVTTVGYVVEIINYVAGVIPKYVAVERCFLVSFTFRVKVFLTRTVLTAIPVLISVQVVGFYASSYFLI